MSVTRLWALAMSCAVLGALLAGCGTRNEPTPAALLRATAPPADEVMSVGRLQAGGAIADPAAFRPQAGTVTDASPPGRVRVSGVATQPEGAAEAPAPLGDPYQGAVVLPYPAAGPVSSPRAIDVYVAAIVGSGNELRLLVVHPESKQRRWVAVGETVFGYRVDLATLRGAILSRDGRQYALELGKGRPTEPQPAGVPSEAVSAGDPSSGPEGGQTSGSEEARFHGRWRGVMDGSAMEMTFAPGGTGAVGAPDESADIDMTWRLSDGRLNLTLTAGASSDIEVLAYRFEDGDRVLVLVPPGDPALRLTRQ